LKTAGRDQDFMTLYLKDDLLIIPTDHFDQLLDRMLSEEIEVADFMQTRAYVIDDTVSPNLPVMLPSTEAPAVGELPLP